MSTKTGTQAILSAESSFECQNPIFLALKSSFSAKKVDDFGNGRGDGEDK